jgi:hypothetical protein
MYHTTSVRTTHLSHWGLNICTEKLPQVVVHIQGASKKTGIMEFCIFFIMKGGYSIKITVSNTYMIKSIQLAIMQAFTAP